MIQLRRAASPQTSLVRRSPSRLGGDEFLDRYLAEIGQIPLLEEDEERDLARAYAGGDLEAGHTLVRAHLRLVAFLASRYRAGRASTMDLIQEGNLGLMRALEKYDPDQGVRFSSYARFWIRARILRYLMENHRILNLARSRDNRRLFFNMDKVRRQLIQAGEAPTERALAEVLDVDEEAVRRVDRHLRAPAMSLEQPLPCGLPLGDTLASEGGDPERAVARRRLTAVVRAVMEAFEDTLEDERERAIWSERLATTDPVSLADLGRRFGVSRERARQLEARMRGRLRALLLAELGPDVDFEFITVGEG